MMDDTMSRFGQLNSLWNQAAGQLQDQSLMQNQMQAPMNQTANSPQQRSYSSYSEQFPMAQTGNNPYGDYSAIKQQMQANQTQMPTPQPQPQAQVQGGGKGMTAASAGQKFIGNSKYVWGAGRKQSDIDNGRFDCSGFVNYAFRQAGVDLGSGNTDTIAKKGTAVNPNSLQPGDIVFFNTYKTNGHVGIYVGNGKFIGSQSKSGVAVEDMTKGYWAKHFSGNARRV